MGNLKKKRRSKIAKHKRRKQRKKSRHKKNICNDRASRFEAMLTRRASASVATKSSPYLSRTIRQLHEDQIGRGAPLWCYAMRFISTFAVPKEDCQGKKNLTI